MNKVIPATLFFTVIFISLLCGTSKRIMCSSRLMDALLETCGSNGINSFRAMFIVHRYRQLRWRHRRGKRDLNEYESNYKEYESSNIVKRAVSSAASSRLSAIVDAGTLINERRKRHVRVRRQISTECCNRGCSVAHLRKAYCNSGR